MSDRNQQDNPNDPLNGSAKPPAPDYATRPEIYRNPPEVHPVTLSPEDAAVLDALLEQGAPQDQSELDPARVKRLQDWLDALATHRVEQPPIDLMNRTLEAVTSDPFKIGGDASRPAPQAATRSHTLSRRLMEYAAMAIAASVLLMVLIPGIGQARQRAKIVACSDNLRVLGNAFDGYGAHNSGNLPFLASPMGASWRPMDPADASPMQHSNTANLLPLIRDDFLHEPTRLACPAMAATLPNGWDATANDVPDSFRGYSYVNMFGPVKPRWDKKDAHIILADRNPIFSASGCASIDQNSFNHAGKGSMVLYSDTSARWQLSPDIGPNGDNIWTVATNPTADRAKYSYKETPADLNDVFLVP